MSKFVVRIMFLLSAISSNPILAANEHSSVSEQKRKETTVGFISRLVNKRPVANKRCPNATKQTPPDHGSKYDTREVLMLFGGLNN
ncbi:hypothetical protein Q7M76_05195 [Candidatus Liberibacter asiaticus]|uniref:Uncharacterized protein n=2 Tax=Liberibacter asiaticus TaxID=34021 RepID=C6XGX7_LIBAP|nr:hypothetical protein [Candidatus Liberibacter asiaticus]ACT57630.1 hypothetical protein CLIBASIA_05320 [Candidatus Liberibacter asiaticus str. psy62]AGH17391.1 hypothetical protein WSI_05170 [Candidatus Liberibacter asiaticus str. gxpsy]ALK07666.1 hypothetical protein CD16_05160 [Candidatus Liberibacter asiaticus]ASK53161.1 hypothetical protein B2I23_05240 [Candidatus Liberibacter asiaticus]KAE9509684.1 hypothetical protein FXW22_05115 [Candidatus Liberibacter asiaticus]